MESSNNASKYFLNDFNISNYNEILITARKFYKFVSFLEKSLSKVIFLRHDIEFSIPIAHRLALIENNLGIQATYFIQLHS